MREFVSGFCDPVVLALVDDIPKTTKRYDSERPFTFSEHARGCTSLAIFPFGGMKLDGDVVPLRMAEATA